MILTLSLDDKVVVEAENRPQHLLSLTRYVEMR